MFRDPGSHRRRRSVRLSEYDYTQAGMYFITVVAHGRQCVFGDLVGGEIRLSEAGRIVRDCWTAIPDHCSGCAVTSFVVMPNHVHGVLTLPDNDGSAAQSSITHTERPRGPVHRSVGAIVGSFKSAATRLINRRCGTPGAVVWQRNYYEHVIRSDASLQRIEDYILSNPLFWAEDPENPDRVARHGATHASPLLAGGVDPR